MWAKRGVKAEHENSGGTNAGCDEGHDSKQWLQLAAGDGVDAEKRAALIEELGETVGGDWQRHCGGVQSDTEEGHVCWRWTILARGGLQAKGREQVAECVKGGGGGLGNLGAAKIVDIVRAVETKGAKHEGDNWRCALAHHDGGAKTERRSDIEVEGVLVLETQKVVVARVEPKLAVRVPELLLE